MELPNGGSVRVRRALENDIPGLLDLLEAVAAEGRWIATEAPVDREDRAARMKKSYFSGPAGRMFIAEIAGRIVGSAGVDNDRGLANVGMIVDRGHRGMGIGSRLLQFCIEWATSIGAHKMILQVWPHNEPAIRLYEKFGLEREGYRRAHYRRKNGEIWDVVEMGLVLGNESEPSI